MEKAEKIKEMLKKGKKLSEILREDPELIEGVDDFIEELKKHSLAASTTPVVKRNLKHRIRRPKKK
jgi:hypothetical protein